MYNNATVYVLLSYPILNLKHNKNHIHELTTLTIHVRMSLVNTT